MAIVRGKTRWKHAVSPVVGTVMMVTLTLTLGTLLIAWAGGSYGAFLGGTQLFFAQRGQALQERFVIENVFFNKTVPDQIYVFVRNVGPIDIKIVAIYVNSTLLQPQSTGHGSTCTFSGSPLSASLGVGSLCEFSVNWPSSSCPPNTCPWVSGNIFNILVASARGNQASTTARGP